MELILRDIYYYLLIVFIGFTNIYSGEIESVQSISPYLIISDIDVSYGNLVVQGVCPQDIFNQAIEGAATEGADITTESDCMIEDTGFLERHLRSSAKSIQDVPRVKPVVRRNNVERVTLRTYELEDLTKLRFYKEYCDKNGVPTCTNPNSAQYYLPAIYNYKKLERSGKKISARDHELYKRYFRIKMSAAK